MRAVLSNNIRFRRSLLGSTVAASSRTPEGLQVKLENLVVDELCVGLDRVDLAELLGNPIENTARLRDVSASPQTTIGLPVVEDDGKGITPPQQARVLEHGARLDERGGAAGLGVAIASTSWTRTTGNWNSRNRNSAAEGDDRSEICGLQAPGPFRKRIKESNASSPQQA